MRTISLILGIAVMLSSLARADQVELTNGDTISGKVVSLNATHLKLHSEVLGDVTLAREKVAAVYLGEKRPAKPIAASGTPAAAETKAAASPDDFIGRLLGKEGAAKKPEGKSTPQDLVDQLQKGGLDAGAVGEVQKMLPLLATKEAGGYFNDTVSGLISGRLGIKEIRKDAIKARDGILDLKKDLGPDADALNPYLGILEKFIRETEPSESTKDEKSPSDQPK